MARRKKPLGKRLASFGLFLVITLIVFNFNFLVKQSLILVGIADLNWNHIARVEIGLEEPTDESVIFTDNDTIIVSANQEIKIYDVDGNFIVARKINSESTKIVGMSEYFIVADVRQGNIFVLDYEGKTTGEIANIGPIKDIIAARDNFFVVINTENELSVYDYEGVLSASVKLPDGELLGLDVSSDKDQVIATILSSDEEHYNSKIITFSMKDSLMIGGHNNYSNIVYGAKVYEDHIMIVDTKGRHAYRVGDSDDYTWDSERDGDLLHFEIDANGSIFELIRRQVINTSEFHLTGTNKDGQSIFDVILNQKYNKIVLTQGKILLQNERILEIYSSDGILLTTYESSKKINDVEWLTPDRIIVEYNDFIEIMELAY